jgi:hypothetical protein
LEMPKLIDFTGQKFGRLTVLSRAPNMAPGKTFWRCLCDCGAHAVFRADQFGRTPNASCGCYNIELAKARLTTHGRSHLPEYRIWAGIKSRCTRPSSAAFHKYGAKGVTVCDRWLTFANFFEDMGPRPSPQHTIDRIDGSKGYEPGNCRWATPTQQQRNLKNNVRITHDGRSLTAGEWSQVVGLKEKTIYSRVSLGWTPEDALTKPLHFHHKHRK